LKLTRKDHSDRLALQIALTELDTLTHRLNEAKRESEIRLEVKRLLAHVSGRHSIKIDKEKTYMIRQDDMIQIVS
jgi:Rho guanine nucleotide exchange factor 10